MSTQQTKQAEKPRPLTKEDLAKLTKLHRPRFTKEQVVAALQYQRDHGCTLDVAAKTQGMTGQTLAKRRDELAAEMGVTEDAPAQAAKPAAKKK